MPTESLCSECGERPDGLYGICRPCQDERTERVLRSLDDDPAPSSDRGDEPPETPSGDGTLAEWG